MYNVIFVFLVLLKSESQLTPVNSQLTKFMLISQKYEWPLPKALIHAPSQTLASRFVSDYSLESMVFFIFGLEHIVPLSLKKDLDYLLLEYKFPLYDGPS